MQAGNTIMMLWALWSGVSIMPFTWILPYNAPPWDTRKYDWEISHDTRCVLYARARRCKAVF